MKHDCSALRILFVLCLALTSSLGTSLTLEALQPWLHTLLETYLFAP